MIQNLKTNVFLKIKTRVPEKYLLIDTETGQIYQGSPNGKWLLVYAEGSQYIALNIPKVVRERRVIPKLPIILRKSKKEDHDGK